MSIVWIAASRTYRPGTLARAVATAAGLWLAPKRGAYPAFMKPRPSPQPPLNK
ncbi:hypothetical protein [Streptomyces similanensis]|uniref:hypothetical protein n=1 Tax=Streptomyces similanensis TaxID=1274988 RepID=UPI0031EB0CF9